MDFRIRIVYTPVAPLAGAWIEIAYNPPKRID